MRKLDLISGISMVLMCGASLVYAGRPARVDDADPPGQGECEIEAGLNYVRESDCRHWDYPFGLNYGIAPQVEMSFAFGGQFEELTEEIAHSHHEGGLCDLVTGAKIRFIDERGWMPRQAMSAAVKFPLADEEKGLGSGETDYDLTWIASKVLSSVAGIHLNVGYSWIGKGKDEEVGDLFHYGAGADIQLCDRCQLLVEVFCDKELLDGTETMLRCSSGVRWEAMDGLILDAAAGTKLHGEAPDVAVTAGMTWTFGGQK